ncbi:ABC transporter substrate-binding protein [Salibacterium lacus]|uniref:ABC transporter substrate-binding protein n=1 Tax=Salibacterium lacus TaxID=1898109 RepID=A0ABW5T3T0_9BACI
MKKWMTGLAMSGMLLLGACGNEESSGSEEQQNTGENQDTRSVTIEDANGEQTIEGTPQNIVALEWYNAEQLLSLGIQPAGVPNVEGYKDWMNTGKELAGSVEDVGTRAEPNLEAISRLNPDLIIAAQFRHEQTIDRLKEIAPVITFAPYNEENSQNLYKALMDQFRTIAKVTDKEQEADQALEELDQFYEEQKQRLAEAGLDGARYVSSMTFSSQNSPTLRLYTDNSYPAQVMSKLGLENVYEADEHMQYGYTEGGVEPLQNFQEEDVQFLAFVQEDDNIFENQLQGNPVWENLSFVEEGNTYFLPGDTPVIGGVSSARALTKEIVDSLVEE